MNQSNDPRDGHDCRTFYWNSDNHRANRSGKPHVQSKHPAHLKGKDIGLFYAKKSKAKANRMKEQNTLPVSIDEHSATTIDRLLDEVNEIEESEEGQHLSDFKLQYYNMIHENKLTDLGHGKVYSDNKSIARNKDLDISLRISNLQEQNRKFQSVRQRLPSYKMKDEIANIIRDNRVVVISGETGCGKTTQVPQYILDDYINCNDGSLCSIVCTQPRRISAISVAERVADEREETCGGLNNSVGYQIRLDAKLPRKYGSVLFCTTGIVLQWLQSDPFLTGYSHIILDEVHERDINTDFLIIILRDLLKQRSDLKLILMSATLNAESFSQYFGNCPMVTIPGFTYPVTEYYLEDAVEHCRYRLTPSDRRTKRLPVYFKYTPKGKRIIREEVEKHDRKMYYLRSIKNLYSPQTVETLENMDVDSIDYDLICNLIKYICQTSGDGGILIFLDGWNSIKKLNDKITYDCWFKRGQFIVIPLHSLMPTVNQRNVFCRPPPGVRKIVIATNIAETSITIDDIVFVIDSGKIKMSNFDETNNVATLEAQWVSLANSRQRKGRAGRVTPGICYHLYTRGKLSELDEYLAPEILRTRLDEVCLRIKILKLGNVVSFLKNAMDPPSVESITIAINLLQKIGALNAEEELTPLGFHLARLPVDPQTGKMILMSAVFSCLDPVLTIAASLSFKEAFIIPLGKEELVDNQKRILSYGSKSDHIALLNAFKGWEDARDPSEKRHFAYSNFLSESTLKMLAELKRQFAQYLHDLKFLHSTDVKDIEANRNSDNIELIKAIICAGLYPNVAEVKTRRPNPNRHHKSQIKLHTIEDGKVVLHPKSVNSKENHFESPWLVYHVKIKSSNITLHDSTMIKPFSLIFFGGNVNIKNNDTLGTTVLVDEWITFRCPERTAMLCKRLREQLDNFLAFKISNPVMTYWNKNDRNVQILNVIVDLITSDERLYSTMKSDHFDDPDKPGCSHR
ncbi:DHX36 (predicted) [Pycnogonum litorale]